jgi:hypothetical protein
MKMAVWMYRKFCVRSLQQAEGRLNGSLPEKEATRLVLALRKARPSIRECCRDATIRVKESLEDL